MAALNKTELTGPPAHHTNDGQSRKAAKVVFGAMTFGEAGTEIARVHELKDCAAMLDMVQRYGINEVDTARVYGTSEKLLGQLDWRGRGISLATKLGPNRRPGTTAYSHGKDDIQRGISDSLNVLKSEKVDLWYLHMPDVGNIPFRSLKLEYANHMSLQHNVPYAETLQAVNELFKAGYFARFGISNYSAWEIAQICEICDRHGWKKPDVYQGCYHALQRNTESELFPCLRNYGISFYAFSPLAGGLLNDRYQHHTNEFEEGSRYDPKCMQGKVFRGRYWNDAYFRALDVIRPVAEKLGLATSEAALRWIRHHSLLDGEKGDALITGASNIAQLEENLEFLEKGPLPKEMVSAFDEAWLFCNGVCPSYFR